MSSGSGGGSGGDRGYSYRDYYRKSSGSPPCSEQDPCSTPQASGSQSGHANPEFGHIPLPQIKEPSTYRALYTESGHLYQHINNLLNAVADVQGKLASLRHLLPAAQQRAKAHAQHLGEAGEPKSPIGDFAIDRFYFEQGIGIWQPETYFLQLETDLEGIYGLLYGATGGRIVEQLDNAVKLVSGRLDMTRSKIYGREKTTSQAEG